MDRDSAQHGGSASREQERNTADSVKPRSVAKQLQDLTDRFAGRSRRERLRELLAGTGREHPDPVPHALSVDFEPPPTIEQMVQQYIRAEVSQAAQADGHDTFEDFDDFEPEDPEQLPFSPYVLTEAQLEAEVPVADAAPPESSPVDSPSGEAAPDTRAPAGSSETEASPDKSEE